MRRIRMCAAMDTTSLTRCSLLLLLLLSCVVWISAQLEAPSQCIMTCDQEGSKKTPTIFISSHAGPVLLQTSKCKVAARPAGDHSGDHSGDPGNTGGDTDHNGEPTANPQSPIEDDDLFPTAADRGNASHGVSIQQALPDDGNVNKNENTVSSQSTEAFETTRRRETTTTTTTTVSSGSTRTNSLAGSRSASTPCWIDVKDCLPPLDPQEPDAEVNYELLMHYVFLGCSDNTRVIVRNENSMRNKQVIGYLHTSGCAIDWSDLATYAEAVDLRVLYLQDRQETFREDLDKFGDLPLKIRGPTETVGASGLKPLPPGLEVVGSLQFINTKSEPEPFPSILWDYHWPRLAEVVLWNMGTIPFPTSLQVSLPRLQSLELVHGQVTGAPTVFPWAQDWLELPLNLSRTPNANQHYSQSQGFVTPPHLYRRIVSLKANRISDLRSNTFQGCVQKIDLSENAIEHISTVTFNSVTCLQHLDLSSNRLTTIPERSFANLSTLTVLDLSQNSINVLLGRDHFFGLTHLQVLDLSHNNLVQIGKNVFHPLTSIETINIASNRLVTIPQQAIQFDLDKLRKVDLKNNALTEIPEWVFLVRTLVDVDLSYNNLTLSRFLSSIKDLNVDYILYNNRWSASQFGEAKRTFIKEINLNHNQFTTLDVSNLTTAEKASFSTILFFFDLKLEGNELNCDCHTYSMHLFLLEEATKAELDTKKENNPYALDNWRCALPAAAAGQLIASVPNTTFKCEAKLEHCPDQCSCLRRAVDQVVEVDCSFRNLTQLPLRLPNNTRILNMGHNQLTSLNNNNIPAYLPDLEQADFCFNNITHISADFLQECKHIQLLSLHHNKLQALPKTLEDLDTLNSVLLSFNRWDCDCHSVWIKQWVVVNRQKVMDLDDVTCGAGRAQGSVLIEVPESDFVCEVPTSVIIAQAAVGILVVLIIIIVISLLIYRYRGEIKVFLYVHFKWHPFDRSEKADVDYEYDAFVSYAGDDYKWVVYQLVARLEGHVPRFKLSLHDRDFEVGAPIQENITHAVKSSRRMILVLTPRYVRSEWCMLEFRAAHDRVLNDRSNYLILILFDNVPVKELDDDMQLYIRTNTYLSVSNKWFWEKLLYAMPKEQLCTLKEDVRFDFPYLTAPPTSYPDYIMGYMATNKVMAQRSELPQFMNEQDDDGDDDEDLQSNGDTISSVV